MKTTSIEEGLNRRNDNLLIIRIIAASLVIYGHAPAISPNIKNTDIFVLLGFKYYSGTIAVNLFFLISGFLVTGSLLRQKGNILNFFKLRAIRVIPAFLVNLIILALFIGPIATDLTINEYFKNPETWKYITKNMKFSADMAWHLPGVMQTEQVSSINESVVNGSIWSIPAEVRMYFLLGIIGLSGLFSTKTIATCTTILLLAIGLFSPQYLPLHQSWLEPGMYFGIGILIFLHRASIHISPLMAISFIVLSFITRHSPGYPITFALTLSSLTFTLAYIKPCTQWLEKYGDPSYGIYLWGWPCQQFIAHTIPQANLALHTILSILLSMLFGYASWHLIEKHVMRFKKPTVQTSQELKS